MAQGMVLLLSSDNSCGFPHTERRGIFQVTGRASVILSVLIVEAMRKQHGKGRWDCPWWGGPATPEWVRGGTPSSHPGLLSPRVSNKAQNHPSTRKLSAGSSGITKILQCQWRYCMEVFPSLSFSCGSPVLRRMPSIYFISIGQSHTSELQLISTEA